MVVMSLQLMTENMFYKILNPINHIFLKENNHLHCCIKSAPAFLQYQQDMRSI